MARVLTVLGSSEAIRTAARLVSWVAPFALRFTSLSVSVIPVKPYELFMTTHKGEYEMLDAAGEELNEQGAPPWLVSTGCGGDGGRTPFFWWSVPVSWVPSLSGCSLSVTCRGALPS